MNALRSTGPAIQATGGARGPLPSGVSVVIPCFNSEGSLTELVEQLLDVLPRCAAVHEIILVNDGSADGTWQVILDLAARHSQLRGLCLGRNYGQHNAVLCGVRAARFDVTVTLDDDLQQPPSEMPKLLAKLAEGHDVVYGIPQTRPHSLYRRLLSWSARTAVKIATRQQTVRDLSPYRAFRTSLRAAFEEFRSPQLLFDVLLGWGTTRIATTTVTHHPRRVGRSNYGFIKLAGTALTFWIGYTTAPLRFASLLGFAFVAFGGAVLAYVLGVYFLEGSLPGFPFLASTIAIFGGVQLFTLGIIGEYLARMFRRSLDQPAYVVRTTAEEENQRRGTAVPTAPAETPPP